MTPDFLVDAHATIGESLLWAPEEALLYWADIKAPCLYAYDPATGENRRWVVPSDLGGFALDGKGRALLALRTGLYWLRLTDSKMEQIVPAPFDSRLIRFNESACDSQGRFWVGTMTDPPPEVDTARTGALYNFISENGLRAYPDFAYITNGMAWNAEESLFFLSHSEEKIVYQYGYDAAQGRLGARQVFVKLDGPGIPDGAAVDEAGDYWCAVHGAGCLHRYTKTGDLAETIELPVSQPTMCCFAGEDMTDLYITSATDGLDEAALKREPHAGGLFRIKVPRPGLKRHWRVR